MPAQPAKGDEMPALKDVLTFLKFTPEETKNLMEAVQSTVKIVGGIVSVVGAATSVLDLMTKLGAFGTEEDATQAKLQQIGTRLNQIYNYLVEQEIKGLYLQAVNWRCQPAMGFTTSFAHHRVVRVPKSAGVAKMSNVESRHYAETLDCVW